MKQTTVYTDNKIEEIKRAARVCLFKYALCAAAFVVLCAAVCTAAALDLLNVYLGCAINVFLSVPFLWGSYLFFKVYYAESGKRAKFVKYLINCNPVKIITKYEGSLKGDFYCGKLKFSDGEFAIEKDFAHLFKEGVQYSLTAVDGVIIAFGEAEQ